MTKVMTEKKTMVNIADEQVLTDGVRLSKSDFVELYVKSGYDKIYSAAASTSFGAATVSKSLVDPPPMTVCFILRRTSRTAFSLT